MSNIYKNNFGKGLSLTALKKLEREQEQRIIAAFEAEDNQADESRGTRAPTPSYA